MIHGAVLSLPHYRRAGKNDGQHGNVIDDCHHAGKPGGRKVRIKRNSYIEIYRRWFYSLRMREEVRYLRGDDLLRMALPEPRLYHRGRIDVDLKPGLASRQNVPFEVRRDIDHESESSAVH